MSRNKSLTKSTTTRLAALLFAIGVLAFGATASHAGTVTTYPSPCEMTHGTDGYGYSLGCGGGVGYFFQPQSPSTSPIGHAIGDSGSYLWSRSPLLPADVSIQALSLEYMASQASNEETNRRIYAGFCVRSFQHGGVTGPCSIPQNFNLVRDSAWRTLTVAGNPNYANWGLRVSPSTHEGFVWIRSVAVQLRDDVAPSATRPSFSATTSNMGWVRGEMQVSASTTDGNGTGIASAAFVPGDPNKKVAAAAGCHYGWWIPCGAGFAFATGFNTALLPDGAHSGHVAATDAAGNVGHSPAVEFKTDNTAPDVANNISITPTGDPRSASGQLDISWVNGAESVETATQSGISRAVVDIDPAVAGQPDLEPMVVEVSGGRDRVQGISVPSRAPWTATVRLIDEAGNVSGESARFAIVLPPAADNGSGGNPLSAQIDVTSPVKLRTSYAAKSKIRGTLRDASGAPIANAEVDVYEQVNVAGATRTKVGSVRTDAHGNYIYTARADASKVVTFVHSAGTAGGRIVEHSVRLYVTGKVRLRARSRRLRVGKSLKLTGSIAAKGLRRGVLVEVQVRDKRVWRTVATRRSTRKGTFRFSHRFSSGGVFKFRARVRKSSDLPIETTSSKALKVRVGR